MANIKLAEASTNVLVDFNVYNLLRCVRYVRLSQSQLNTVHIRKYRANTSVFGQSVMNVYVIPSLRLSFIQSFRWCAHLYIYQYKHTKVNIHYTEFDFDLTFAISNTIFDERAIIFFSVFHNKIIDKCSI